MTVQPFEINIEPTVLDDLRDRLRDTRWPDEIDSAGWDYGMNSSVLRSFVHTWAEEFDWPTRQTRLNQYPHLRIDVDGLGGQPYTPEQSTVPACRWYCCTAGRARSCRCCPSFRCSPPAPTPSMWW